MGKIKTRLLQARYYIAMAVCAGTVLGGLSMTWNKVEIKPTDEDVICAIGDQGNANEGQAKVTQAMHDHGCTILLHLGDIIYPVGVKSADDKRVRTHFLNYYEDFKQNIITLGNHDLYSMRQGMEAWLELGKRYSNIVYPSHFFPAYVGDVCIVSWNSEIVERADDSEFVEKQAAFIDGLDLSKCKIKISLSHHPYRSSGNHGNCQKEVCEFYEKHIIGKFDYALQGHDHDAEYSGEFSGTKFYVSGNGSELRSCDKKTKNKTCFEKLGFLKFVDGVPKMIFVE